MLSKSYKGPYYIELSDYNLIYENKQIDAISKYSIEREDNRIRFRNKGYTLFFLQKQDDQTILLQGLDGYGMRDHQFLKFVKKLIEDFVKAS